MSGNTYKLTSSKLLFFRPPVLIAIASWYKSKRRFADSLFGLLVSYQVCRRRFSDNFSKESTEGRQAVKSHQIANIGDMHLGFQKALCFFDSDMLQILMRRLSVDGFKEADKMEFGEVRFAGNVAKIYFRRIVVVDEKFGLNDSSI
jgi:hypothetical protein